MREDPAWPLPPPPRPAPAPSRHSRALHPAEAIAAALRAGHTPEALHRMIDQAAAGLAALPTHAPAPIVVAESALVPSAAAPVAPHPAPAAAFPTQGSFMADLMDEVPDPSAPPAAPAPHAAPANGLPSPAAGEASTGAQPDGAAEAGAGPPMAARQGDGDAAPLAMQLSMSELLGDEDGPPECADLSTPAPRAQPTPAAPPVPAIADQQEPRSTPAMPSAGPEGARAANAPSVPQAGPSAEAPAAESSAVSSERVLPPDPLAVQDSGYEADVEAATAEGANQGQVQTDADGSGGDLGGQLEAVATDVEGARTDGVDAL